MTKKDAEIPKWEKLWTGVNVGDNADNHFREVEGYPPTRKPEPIIYPDRILKMPFSTKDEQKAYVYEMLVHEIREFKRLTRDEFLFGIMLSKDDYSGRLYRISEMRKTLRAEGHEGEWLEGAVQY